MDNSKQEYAFKYKAGDIIAHHPNYPHMVLSQTPKWEHTPPYSRYPLYTLLDLTTGRTITVDAPTIDLIHKPIEYWEGKLPQEEDGKMTLYDLYKDSE